VDDAGLKELLDTDAAMDPAADAPDDAVAELG
jgi:hypothetical protein